MDRRRVGYFISALAYLAVFYPIFVWYERVDLVFDETLLLNLSPVLGLAAFSIMWLHVVGGALRGWLEKYFNFERLATNSSIAVLFLIILHPLLFFIGIGLDRIGDTFIYYEPIYIWLAIIGWFVLVGYDVAKRFKNRDFFARHWNSVKFISTLGFFLVFFHSLGLGSDLQAGPLRYVWIFYGITAAAATIYTYGIKKFLK